MLLPHRFTADDPRLRDALTTRDVFRVLWDPSSPMLTRQEAVGAAGPFAGTVRRLEAGEAEAVVREHCGPIWSYRRHAWVEGPLVGLSSTPEGAEVSLILGFDEAPFDAAGAADAATLRSLDDLGRLLEELSPDRGGVRRLRWPRPLAELLVPGGWGP